MSYYLSAILHSLYNLSVQSERTILPPPPPLTEYERLRAIRIKQNNEVLYSLRLPELSAELTNNVPKSKGIEKAQDESEGYDPEQDARHDVGSDGDVSVTPPKVCPIQSSFFLRFLH